MKQIPVTNKFVIIVVSVFVKSRSLYKQAEGEPILGNTRDKINLIIYFHYKDRHYKRRINMDKTEKKILDGLNQRRIV